MLLPRCTKNHRFILNHRFKSLRVINVRLTRLSRLFSAAGWIRTLFLYLALVSASDASPKHQTSQTHDHSHDLADHLIEELRTQHPVIDAIGEVIQQQRSRQPAYPSKERRPEYRDPHGHASNNDDHYRHDDRYHDRHRTYGNGDYHRQDNDRRYEQDNHRYPMSDQRYRQHQENQYRERRHVQTGRRSGSRDFGIRAVNDHTLRVYHYDRGWTATFRYLCLNEHCYSAERDGDYYVYDFPARRGANYTIKIKVQDEHTAGGQFIDSKQVRF